MNGQDPDQRYDHPGRRARRAKRRGVAGPILAAVAVLGLLAGGGWYVTHQDTRATGQNQPPAASTSPQLPDQTADTRGADIPGVDTPSATPSRTPSATPTRTPTRTPAQTRTPKATPTPSRSATAPSRGGTRSPKPSATPSQTSTTARPSTNEPAQTSDGSKEAQVVALTNAERQKAGCGPLQTNSALTRAADGHAADMVANHYFDHTSLDGRSPFDRMEAAGFSGGAMAENIAAGYSSAAAVVEGWMNSDGHRRNILNCDYTMIGIGYDPGQVKAGWGSGSWVQNFGG